MMENGKIILQKDREKGGRSMDASRRLRKRDGRVVWQRCP